MWQDESGNLPPKNEPFQPQIAKIERKKFALVTTTCDNAPVEHFDGRRQSSLLKGKATPVKVDRLKDKVDLLKAPTVKGLVHLPHRNGWYLRIRVPSSLVPHVGKREVVQSLAGVSDSELVDTAMAMLNEIKVAFVDIEKMILTDSRIKRVARQYLDGTLSALQVVKMQRMLEDTKPNKRATLFKAEIARLQGAGIHASHLAPSPKAEEAPKGISVVPVVVEAPKVEEPKGLTLKEAGQAYIEANRNDWAEKTLKGAEYILTDLCFVFGTECPIESITHRDLIGFREKLSKLPPNRSRNPELSEKTCDELIKMRHDKVMSPGTILLRMTSVTSLFNYLERHEYLTGKNPAHDLLPKVKRGQIVPREAFTREDIQLIKSKLLEPIAKNPKAVDKYWVTLIAMYTGARASEVANLRREDIVEVDGVHCLSIKDTETNDLKNAASIRTLPIHQFLHDSGFMTFVKSKKGRLFASNATRATGTWFCRSIQTLLPNRKVVFHSLRHTVATSLQQAGVQLEVIAAILGHSQESITFSTYGKGYTMPQLSEAIAKLDY